MTSPEKWHPHIPQRVAAPAPPVPPAAPVIKPTNHLLHALLCIPTFGFWLFVWPCWAILNNVMNSHKQTRFANAQARYQWEVDQYNQWQADRRRQQQWHAENQWRDQS